MGTPLVAKISNDNVTIYGKRFSATEAYKMKLSEVDSPDIREALLPLYDHCLDHVEEDTVTVYLLRERGDATLLLAFEHYEDGYLVTMMKLLGSLAELITLSEEPDMKAVSIVLLDTYAEKMIVEVRNVSSEILW